MIAEWAEAAPMFESAGVDRPVDVAEDGRYSATPSPSCWTGSCVAPSTQPARRPADRAAAGVVIDLSAFHGRRAVHTFTAVAACAWLEAAATLAEEPGGFPRRYNIVDDAWLLMGDEHASRYLASFLGRSRLTP